MVLVALIVAAGIFILAWDIRNCCIFELFKAAFTWPFLPKDIRPACPNPLERKLDPPIALVAVAALNWSKLKESFFAPNPKACDKASDSLVKKLSSNAFDAYPPTTGILPMAEDIGSLYVWIVSCITSPTT